MSDGKGSVMASETRRLKCWGAAKALCVIMVSSVSLLFWPFFYSSIGGETKPTKTSEASSRVAVPSLSPSIYKVEGIRVIDGDTVEARFYIWSDIMLCKVVRLEGIDAPEVYGPAKLSGLAAKEYLESRLAKANEIYLRTDKNNDKYGRLLAVILVRDVVGLVNLNEEMLAKGHAHSL